MMMTDVDAGPEGFERRSFECRRCGCKETRMVACDPMKSDAVGWLSGELGQAGAAIHTSKAGSPRDATDT
jgi:hypothetical protein